jgi:mannose-6-phosphate isomerase-like protein (cupin superfamily)
MNYASVDIKEKFKKFDECWSPKIIGEMNDYYIKLAKIKDHFTWHKHEETDEVFIVYKGNMRIDFRDGFVNLIEGQMFVIPKNVEHKPYAENVCEIMLLEPRTTLNTGNVKDKFTKENLEWI